MNDRGFSLIEMLVSLSILLMISTYIIPTLMEILTERKDLIIQNEGEILLLEQINTYQTNGYFKKEIELNGIVYTFTMLNNEMIVSWVNRNKEKEFYQYEVLY